MKDLNLPKTMELMRDPEEMVANIIPPKTLEQIAAEEASEQASQPKIEKEAVATSDKSIDKDKASKNE